MVVRGRGACQETGKRVAQAATVRNGTAKGLAMDMGHGLEPGRSFRMTCTCTCTCSCMAPYAAPYAYGCMGYGFRGVRMSMHP